MSNKNILLLILIGLVGFSCIKDDVLDDFVPPKIKITNKLVSLTNGLSFKFNANYSNNIGNREDVTINWSSSDESIVSIASDGTASGKGNGTAKITASYQNLTEEFDLEVQEYTITLNGDTIADSMDSVIITPPAVRTGTLVTTSSYIFGGTFKLEDDNGELTLTLNSDFKGDPGLPGLTMYLTNNPATNNGAYELGPISNNNGENVYIIPASAGISINDYSHVLGFCKPFTVKVGDGPFDN